MHKGLGQTTQTKCCSHRIFSQRETSIKYFQYFLNKMSILFMSFSSMISWKKKLRKRVFGKKHVAPILNEAIILLPRSIVIVKFKPKLQPHDYNGNVLHLNQVSWIYEERNLQRQHSRLNLTRFSLFEMIRSLASLVIQQRPSITMNSRVLFSALSCFGFSSILLTG